ncbi:DNA cytosine methyltransferase [Haloterrigena sp. SYSU A558-1]|uniref:DNA (cytosine-5-)-methyltransferase n=1 Tax=Haloterrigena gelatinilytica TaxID=2741724 RepID=A0ABX2LH11_9EURY|nr:DNA cytosine methyltransferase [Haloterrigena gelatinilytica]NUC74735.1 DNA cytosine methyltransferase [Haloterrigena gelatinilytica]
MLEGSSPMGQFWYQEENDLRERIGHCDPPIGVSLFSGAGGFDLGFAQAGFDVRVMVEYEQEACDTLRLNRDCFNDYTEPTIIQEDIREIGTSEILNAANVGIGGTTAVYGGPPCQGFSMSGNRDPDDERNALYREMVRVVHQAKPVFFVMENVPGLATMEDGKVIQRVCDEFRQGGYNVTWDILNAANYGVPQRRKRVFVMGKRIDFMTPPPFGIGNPQMHIGAVPGRVDHPDFFIEKHGLQETEQATLDTFTNEPETLDEALEQMIQDGDA